MNVLSLVQTFCGLKTLPVPSALIGVNETSTVQLREILKQVVRDLLEYQWETQKIRKSFTAVGAEDQGALTSVFGADYKGLVQGTFWNDTLKRPVFGPDGDNSWQMYKSFQVVGPVNTYRVDGGHLRMLPAPTAGHSLSAIYLSSYAVVSSGGSTKETITVDDDSLLFPDNVVLKGLEYNWNKRKGEPWTDDYNDYISLVAKGLIKDTGQVYWLSSPSSNLRPGIIIPAGSWNV